MVTNWHDLKHKSSPMVRANLKKEAHVELDRIGFHKLRQARQQTQVSDPLSGTLKRPPHSRPERA